MYGTEKDQCAWYFQIRDFQKQKEYYRPVGIEKI
jgi:hypothetical protein